MDALAMTSRTLPYWLAWLLLTLSHAVHADSVVDDVTQLNPIHVREIIQPTSINEISEAIRAYLGPISIGGGRFSMGGQTATRDALQIDMRHFDQVVARVIDRQSLQACLERARRGVASRHLVAF